MTELEPVVGEVEGYRIFGVEGDVLSSFAVDYDWVPGKNRARCTEVGKFVKESGEVWVNGPDGRPVKKTIEEEEGHGPIPSPACRCGFWFYKTRGGCNRLGPQHPVFAMGLRPHRIPFGSFGQPDDDGGVVMGKVKGWGRVIEGADGYRAEWAWITHLVTDSPDAYARIVARYKLAVIPESAEGAGFSEGAIVKVEESDIGPVMVETYGGKNPDGTFLVKPGSEVHHQLVAAGTNGPWIEFHFETQANMRWITELTVVEDEDE